MKAEYLKEGKSVVQSRSSEPEIQISKRALLALVISFGAVLGLLLVLAVAKWIQSKATRVQHLKEQTETPP